jgi:hypothetical protein
MKSLNNSQLGYYLAGLIEGDGNIWIPKTIGGTKGYLCNPRIGIAFHKRELPFFEKLISIFDAGGIYQPK